MARAELLTPPNVIIASVVVVSVLGWASPAVKQALILVPRRVREKGEVHRLLTAGWLHGDWNHLLLNLLTFYFFATVPLRILGDGVFVALYVSAVVVGFVPTTLRHMKDPRYASLGASGAVSAVMFSAIALEPKSRVHIMFLPIAVPAFLFAIGYLAYSVWNARRSNDGVNHDAHFSGAIYGAVFTYLAAQPQVTRALRSLF